MSRHAALLWALLGCFTLRVLGQLLVALFGVGFLPPMAQWYSGLIPYQVLLPLQIGIIALAGAIAWQVTLGRGMLAVPRRRVGVGLVGFGGVYAAAMGLRLVLGVRPLMIPIVFHWVLAGFVLVYGHFHWAGGYRADH